MRMFHRLLAVVCLLGLAWLLLGTVQGGQKPRIDLRGTIKNVTPVPKASEKTDLLGTILVEGTPRKGTQQEKASIRITAATRIVRKLGEERRPAMFTDLKPGLQVEAIYAGPVAESFPVQVTASEIAIVPALATKP